MLEEFGASPCRCYCRRKGRWWRTAYARGQSSFTDSSESAVSSPEGSISTRLRGERNPGFNIDYPLFKRPKLLQGFQGSPDAPDRRVRPETRIAMSPEGKHGPNLDSLRPCMP